MAFLSNSSVAIIQGNITGPSTGLKIIGGTSPTSDLFLQTTSGIGTTGADMHFLVGNNGATEAMTILNSGNVGVGTGSPGAKLDVNGGILLSGTSSYPLVFDPAQLDTDAPAFRLGVGVFPGVNGVDPRANVVTTLGWNLQAGGGRYDTNEVAQGLSFESYYVLNGIAGSEFHITTTDLNGVEHRSFTAFMPRDGGVGSGVNLTGDVVRLDTYAGTTTVQFNLAAHTIGLNESTRFVLDVNNAVFATQRNAAGNAFINLPYINNLNQLAIEAPLYGSGEIIRLQQTHVQFDNNYGIMAKNTSGTAVNVLRFDSNNELGIGQFSGGIILQPKTGGRFAMLNGAHSVWHLYMPESTGNLALGGTNTPSKLTVSGGVTIGSAYALANITAPTNGMIVEGTIGVGTSNPTAYLNIKAGTATASTAPLKLTSGTVNTTAETGAIEYNGTNLSFVPTGTLRENIFTGARGSITLTAGTTTTVTIAQAKTTSTILISPTSLAVISLTPYVSTKNNGSFVITTLTAAGTETLDYIIVN